MDCVRRRGKIVGYSYLSPFNPRDAYIYTCDIAIYINPKCLGKGFGKVLMNKMLHLAKLDGYKKIVSIVTQENTASQSLQDDYGFQLIAKFDEVGYKFGRWLGVFFYEKILNDEVDITQKPKNLDPKIVNNIDIQFGKDYHE